jgi:hypothetical protein
MTFIWKKYRRIIVSTVLLFTFFWLVNFAHTEFLSFSQLQEQQTDVSMSFFIKWLCLTIGFIIYWIFISWKSKKIVKEIHNIHDNNEADPFAVIRNKDKLRTRSEIMIEKNTKNARDNK